MSTNKVIGIDNRLPWHLPADLKHFRAITMGKPMLMGRKTFQSIGRALPGRQTAIVTSNREFRAPGCKVFHSIDEALTDLDINDEVMVIGGAALYAALLPKADRIYLTLIHEVIEGDTYFPAGFDIEDWRQLDRQDVRDDNPGGLSYTFFVLDNPSSEK